MRMTVKACFTEEDEEAAWQKRRFDHLIAAAMPLSVGGVMAQA